MEINERNIRIDSALRAALKIGALSMEEYDSACRLITAGEKATPQPTTQFEAWARRHHYDLVRCSHEPYAAYRSDLTNAALAGWRGANGEALQPDHYQQLLGVAYVVLGCLAANGVDIPERFLDAFSDPDSVENPLELLPCDFSPARAVRAAVEAAALTDEQREAIKYARSVMGSVSWETPDSIRAKAVLDALLTAPKEELSLRAQFEDACIEANKNAKDAARYRWLRNTDPQPARMLDVCNDFLSIIDGKELDEAIDAALAQKEGR